VTPTEAIHAAAAEAQAQLGILRHAAAALQRIAPDAVCLDAQLCGARLHLVEPPPAAALDWSLHVPPTGRMSWHWGLDVGGARVMGVVFDADRARVLGCPEPLLAPASPPAASSEGGVEAGGVGGGS
jgi:hypothetical protein